MSDDTIYQLKISIAGAKPPIWRRVQVPARITLAQLHEVIQALMGWYDSHLHLFDLPHREAETKSLKTNKARRDAIHYGPKIGDDGPFSWDEDLSDEALAALCDVMPTEKGHFLYTYDMGDSWDHDIVVEKILPADPNIAYPVCVTGQRNGPIEDCGGIWGYEDLLQILADKTHEEHDERKEWLKDAYGVSKWDGDAFALDQINKKLKKLQPKPKRVAKNKM